MKINRTLLLTLLLAGASLFACDGNCVSCHPKLVKNGKMDKNHKILRTCIQCHTKKENEKNHGACGQDCWQCHDITKVNKIDIPQHRALPKCIKCHESINKHLLIPDSNPFQGDVLKSIINGK